MTNPIPGGGVRLRIRLLAKWIKARSRTTYYVLSYATKLGALGGLLYLLLR